MLSPHHAYWNVVGTESAMELSLRQLVVHVASGGVVDTPRASHHVAAARRREPSPPPCNVGAQTWT
jgi:hypothetical protein